MQGAKNVLKLLLKQFFISLPRKLIILFFSGHAVPIAQNVKEGCWAEEISVMETKISTGALLYFCEWRWARLMLRSNRTSAHLQTHSASSALLFRDARPGARSLGRPVCTGSSVPDTGYSGHNHPSLSTSSLQGLLGNKGNRTSFFTHEKVLTLRCTLTFLELEICATYYRKKPKIFLVWWYWIILRTLYIAKHWILDIWMWQTEYWLFKRGERVWYERNRK